jgi:hypothetical protein
MEKSQIESKIWRCAFVIEYFGLLLEFQAMPMNPFDAPVCQSVAYASLRVGFEAVAFTCLQSE